MIELIATVESIQQAKTCLKRAWTRFISGKTNLDFAFRYRLHVRNKRINGIGAPIWKKASVAVNAIFHNEGIALVPEYLTF